MIVNKDKMPYIIYINNTQFTCLFEDSKNIENIPKILDIPELKFIKEEKNKIYYQSEDIKKVKLNLDGNFIEDKFLPLSMTLNRVRDILSQKTSINFNFCFDNYIIQKQEEKFCCLKNILTEDVVYLSSKEFNFNDKKDINKNSSNITSSNKKDVKNEEKKEEKINEINNINNNVLQKQENEKKQNEDTNKSEDKKEKNKLETKDNNKLQSENKVEEEYVINSKNTVYYKIKINPEATLTNLRENIINIIPKRFVFLEKGKEIPPSKEDKIQIKNIADKYIINFKSPKENEEGMIIVEIFLNAQHFGTKEFFLKTKLKTIKVHLNLDEAYKFIYKDKLLSSEEESKMILDELCYKESKIFLVKLKEKDKGTLNLKNFNNIIILEKKKYINNSFTQRDIFDNWIIFGKEKSGKTSFINCILNYLNDIKFEDSFRYFIEGKKENGYEKYDIQGNSQKIRIVEFPGFSGEPKKDSLIIKDIKEYLRKLNNLKLICFVISGNETRLDSELKNIFYNIFDIFPSETKNNFIFLLTNCDLDTPPSIKHSIKEYKYLQFLFEQNEKRIFRFNNSYLDEAKKKEIWNIGIAHYKELIDNINKKNNISLETTKYFIDFDFNNISENFIESIKVLICYKKTINILNNINNNSYKNEIIVEIPHYDNKKGKICKQQISSQSLKNNKKYLIHCLNEVKKFQINSGVLYQELKIFYDIKLFPFSLEKDLIAKIDDENKSSLIQEIYSQQKCYNQYLEKNIKMTFKQYLETLDY